MGNWVAKGTSLSRQRLVAPGKFCVTTRLGMGLSYLGRHRVFSVAAGLAVLVLRPSFWCRDRRWDGWLCWCRDRAHPRARRKQQGLPVRKASTVGRLMRDRACPALSVHTRPRLATKHCLGSLFMDTVKKNKI